MSGSHNRISIRPLSSACGAEVLGIDLHKPIDAETISEIQSAWNEHCVIVFRDQNISQEEQAEFASRFGQVGERNTPPVDLASRTEGSQQTDRRFLLVTNLKDENGEPIGAFGDAEMWFHIDGGYSARPYQYSFLYAMTLPSQGGNTLFANMYKAFEAVPQQLKVKLADKRALHIHEYKRAEKIDLSRDISGSPHYFHPVFTTHPRSGRKTLFIDRLMTQRIEGVSAAESESILQQLYEISERSEFVYAHNWRKGDLVCWDNRAVTHARTPFPAGEGRLLRRCTVVGGEVLAA